MRTAVTRGTSGRQQEPGAERVALYLHGAAVRVRIAFAVSCIPSLVRLSFIVVSSAKGRDGADH